jgi:hypothetical protein
MHLGLLLILMGHVRAFTDFYFLWDLLRWGEEEQHLFSAVAGTIAGVLFTLPLFYLLARRWSGAVKWLSTPEDFFVLFLLLGIALTGFHMRLLQEVAVRELHRFFGGWPLSAGSRLPQAPACLSSIRHGATAFPFDTKGTLVYNSGAAQGSQRIALRGCGD